MQPQDYKTGEVVFLLSGRKLKEKEVKIIRL